MLKTAAIIEIMKTRPMRGIATSVTACCLRGRASTFFGLSVEFMYGSYMVVTQKQKTTITTAVPLKTPCVWGMLRNLSWGRLERNASLSWDWTQRRKTKITHVKVSTSKIKSSYSVNRVSDAEMDSHFMRAWHPEQGSIVGCHGNLWYHGGNVNVFR